MQRLGNSAACLHSDQLPFVGRQNYQFVCCQLSFTALCNVFDARVSVDMCAFCSTFANSSDLDEPVVGSGQKDVV